ncbi:beta-ketoacyl-[acyl-carrier-protein] synthase family protein [Rhodospirillum sp. A1_3_36]|uniref:beta-ketoacyl-[acyl-carrier-protein] synthase family protein n=1 Tax=Rhodospirillum sp. A1_3_36 TaxID=3391666 RepID=UPI0039A45C30
MTEGASASPGVVVTGGGVLSGHGRGRDDFEAGLFSGVSAIRPITAFDLDGFSCRFGAQVPDFDGASLIRKSDRHLYDRVSLMAMAAADEALEQAGLSAAEIGPICGVMMGSAFGPGESIQDSVLRFDGNQRLRPTSIVKMMLNSPTAALCARYGVERASSAHVTACAASGHAIAAGVRAIQRGDMDLCLAGGVDAFPIQALFAAWDALAVMTSETDEARGIMRPFAPDRAGFVIGEAATVLVLERRDRALARGAPILGEVLGSGAASDTPNLTKPTRKGMEHAMRWALKDAGLTVDAVGHVNAHGTATALNDSLEWEAIEDLFGERASALPISACKASFGHCMGAGSATEALATFLSLNRGEAPCAVGTAGTLGTRSMDAQVALSNSFAFGGHYVSLVLSKGS